ncbi:ferredoxin-fold anticodon-binding domain-containing protein 1 homolog [Nilaparvata lugens]|uniref:ferredoxin-fold anticodon-binding domain-containing protein 1 homolog n=1 Tax=Nilaparvata lugens TaxID=108931 RepID=UPI00193D70B7|nr:ferredoxin-fold anticodon-binding domain-containing protein 1 homolog [Nilaparvata lugens]
MECFISESDDKILLVGEGNFSFSVDFVNYVKKYNRKFFSYNDNKCCIISTCFEPENKITTIASVNANILQEKGIRVEFGVDARCLEQYAFLAAGVHRHPFSRVIFNFPHVGGKMRIERNRQLLRDFLVSASQVVQRDGVVCVSLCAGQGGSTVENGGKTERRWDDSWKALKPPGGGNAPNCGSTVSDGRCSAKLHQHRV